MSAWPGLPATGTGTSTVLSLDSLLAGFAEGASTAPQSGFGNQLTLEQPVCSASNSDILSTLQQHTHDGGGDGHAEAGRNDEQTQATEMQTQTMAQTTIATGPCGENEDRSTTTPSVPTGPHDTDLTLSPQLQPLPDQSCVRSQLELASRLILLPVLLPLPVTVAVCLQRSTTPGLSVETASTDTSSPTAIHTQRASRGDFRTSIHIRAEAGS